MNFIIESLTFTRLRNKNERRSTLVEGSKYLAEEITGASASRRICTPARHPQPAAVVPVNFRL